MAALVDAVGLPVAVGVDRHVQRGRGGAVVIGVLVAIVVSPWFGVVVGVVGWQLPARLERGRLERTGRELVDDTLLAVELCAVAVHTGATVPHTIEVVAPHVPGELGDALRRVVAGYRKGRLLDDLLCRVVDDTGEQTADLVGLLRAAHIDGDRVGPALDRLADRLRDDRRRLVDVEVRRLSVRLLVPLVCCSLPGFVLVALVPLAVGALGNLGR